MVWLFLHLILVSTTSWKQYIANPIGHLILVLYVSTAQKYWVVVYNYLHVETKQVNFTQLIQELRVPSLRSVLQFTRSYTNQRFGAPSQRSGVQTPSLRPSGVLHTPSVHTIRLYQASLSFKTKVFHSQLVKCPCGT